MASTISHCRLIVAEPSYSVRRASARAGRIARARYNLAQARCVESVRSQAPSEHSHSAAAWWWSIAIGCHAAMGYLAVNVPVAPRVKDTAIQVRMLAVPSTPVTEAPVEITKAPVESRPTIKRKRKPAPTPAPENPKSVEPAADAAPPVEVVGLSLASTAEGKGTAFATGSTLEGSTDQTATAPIVHAPVPDPAAIPAPLSRNRTARTRPSAGVRVEPARRLSRIEPEYPPLLQSQHVEGDVTLRVSLTPAGRVEDVQLVRAAAEAAFNAAALAAARREQFAPETHDGRPVSTSLTYTYRFRISL